MRLVQTLACLACTDPDVVAGGQAQGLACVDGGSPGIDILTCAEVHAASAGDLGAHIQRARLAQVVLAVPVDILAAADRNRVEVQLVASGEHGGAGTRILYLRRREIEVVARTGYQHAGRPGYIDARDAIDPCLGKAVAACLICAALRGGCEVQVTPCGHRGRVHALDHACEVVKVLPGCKLDVVARHLAAQILDVLGRDVQGVAARNAAAVDDISGKVQVHIRACQQGACAVQVAWA